MGNVTYSSATFWLQAYDLTHAYQLDATSVSVKLNHYMLCLIDAPKVEHSVRR
jgi:hypothetical protein